MNRLENKRYIPISKLNIKDIQCFQETMKRTWDIAMTCGCNLACDYCCANCNVVSEYSKDVLSKEHIDKLINIIDYYHNRDFGISRTLVKLYGGEPLLNKNLFYFIDTLWDKFKKYENNSKYLQVVVITNGTLLDDEFVNNLKLRRDKMGVCLSINISVDGYKENHDLHRITKDGKPTFDKIIENIDKIDGEYSVMTTLQAVLTPTLLKNSDKFFNFIRERANGPMRSFGILPMNDQEFSVYSKEEIEEMFKKFHDEIFKNIDLLLNRRFLAFQFSRVISSLLSDEDKGRTFCNAGNHNVSVMANGEIYPCHIFFYNREKEMKIVNIDDENVIERLDEVFERWRKITYYHNKCDDCKYGMYKGAGCLGGCIGHNWRFRKSNNTPEHVCIYNKFMYDIAIEIFYKYPKVFYNYLTFKYKDTMDEVVILAE